MHGVVSSEPCGSERDSAGKVQYMVHGDKPPAPTYLTASVNAREHWCVECSAGRPATNLMRAGREQGQGDGQATIYIGASSLTLGNNQTVTHTRHPQGTGTDSIRICQNDKRYRRTATTTTNQQETTTYRGLGNQPSVRCGVLHSVRTVRNCFI